MLKLLAGDPEVARARHARRAGAAAVGGLRPARFPQDRARASCPPGRAHLRPSERGRRPYPAGLVRRPRSPGSTMSRATSRRSPTASPGCAPGPISPTAPTGSPSPAAMAERTMAVEEKLSDALHERLTQRFVDRRTAVLMRDLGAQGRRRVPGDRSTSRARSASAPMRSAGCRASPSRSIRPRATPTARCCSPPPSGGSAGEYEKRAAALVADTRRAFHAAHRARPAGRDPLARP